MDFQFQAGAPGVTGSMRLGPKDDAAVYENQDAGVNRRSTTNEAKPLN